MVEALGGRERRPGGGVGYGCSEAVDADLHRKCHAQWRVSCGCGLLAARNPRFRYVRGWMPIGGGAAYERFE
jgi:hypothetical protein